MAVIGPLTLRCGDSWSFDGPLNDNNGNPLTLAGATITWTLDSLDFSTNYCTLTVGQGITITNQSTATVSYGPTPTQTAAVPPGTYYQMLRVLLAAGEEYTEIEGIIVATPGPV